MTDEEIFKNIIKCLVIGERACPGVVGPTLRRMLAKPPSDRQALEVAHAHALALARAVLRGDELASA